MNKCKKKIIIYLIISAIIFSNSFALFKKAYSAETSVTLETGSGGIYTIEYLGRSEDGLTWNYQVTEEEGTRHALSHWVLGLFECFTEENVSSTDPEFSDFGLDPTTQVYGIKWDSSDVPEFDEETNDSVTFSITFDQVYKESENGIQVAVKTGGNSHEGDDLKTATGYITGPSCEIEITEQICETGPHWASEIVESNQGTLNSNLPIVDPNRTNPEFTLNENDGNFFSVGKGGEIILSFQNNIFDIQENTEEDIFGNGYDLALYETTWGNRMSYPEEKVVVEISQDGENWMEIGEAGSRDENGISYLDIAETGLEWFKFVKITDSTDFALHGPDADGYDLDAVSSAYSCYYSLVNDPADLLLVKNTESGTVSPGEYLIYSLAYSNTGEDTACDVRIFETVPQHTIFEGQAGWTCIPDTYPAQEGTQCYYELGELEPGTGGLISFTVKLNPQIYETDQIINTAEITTSSEEEFVDNNNSTANTPLILNEQEDEKDKKEEENNQEEDKENKEEDDNNNNNENEDNQNEDTGNNENTEIITANRDTTEPETIPLAQPAIMNPDSDSSSVVLSAHDGNDVTDAEILASTGQPAIVISSLGLLSLLLLRMNHVKYHIQKRSA